MSFFSKIRDKLGLGEAKAAPAPRTTPGTGTASNTTAPSPPKPATPPPFTPMAEVDVTAKMNGLAAASAQKLNWQTSIVDLLKLLDIDSSLSARKELATELGCPADLMGDSAKMNMWLHKAVLRKIAENGGKVPKELLD